MRVLLSGYDSRGGVEPLAGLAVGLRALGAEVRVCAPPDEEFAKLLAGVGVPMVPVGQSVRALVTGATPPSAGGVPQRGSELIAAQLDKLAAVAEGCDVLVATGLLPAAAGARAVAEKLGIRYVYAAFQPVSLPSPHHPPLARPGKPLPPEVTDNQALWELDAESANALFGAALNTHLASIGLPPVDDVRDYAFTYRPWLAADPILAPWHRPTDLDVVQTGAWIRPDERPLPADLEAFLDTGTTPVYVGVVGLRPGRPRVRTLKAELWCAGALWGLGTDFDGALPTTEGASLFQSIGGAVPEEVCGGAVDNSGLRVGRSHGEQHVQRDLVASDLPDLPDLAVFGGVVPLPDPVQLGTR